MAAENQSDWRSNRSTTPRSYGHGGSSFRRCPGSRVLPTGDAPNLARSALHNRVHTVPVEAEQPRCMLYVSTGLNHLNCKSLKQQREPRMLARPRDLDGFDATRLPLGAGRPGSESCLELHGIEVPPGALASMIRNRALRTTLRALHSASPMLQRNLHPFFPITARPRILPRQHPDLTTTGNVLRDGSWPTFSAAASAQTTGHPLEFLKNPRVHGT